MNAQCLQWTVCRWRTHTKIITTLSQSSISPLVSYVCKLNKHPGHIRKYERTWEIINPYLSPGLHEEWVEFHVQDRALTIRNGV